jgi:hypothetical protein
MMVSRSTSFRTMGASCGGASAVLVGTIVVQPWTAVGVL